MLGKEAEYENEVRIFTKQIKYKKGKHGILHSFSAVNSLSAEDQF
jgi:hypothetical protein